MNMVGKTDNNPLEELFTDAGSQIDPASLVVLLKPFLRINRENQRILFTPPGMTITANNKIILFILARKVTHLQGLSESDSVTPKEIKEELGKNIPSGTIDAALKRLSERGPLKGQDGKYFIPDFNFPQVQEIFSKLSGENYGH
jgi:hypothetical protein